MLHCDVVTPGGGTLQPPDTPIDSGATEAAEIPGLGAKADVRTSEAFESPEPDELSMLL